MDNSLSTLIPGRGEAGQALGKLLLNCKNENSVVVGIPNGGIVVASSIAETLNLPLETIFSRIINHPSENHKILGSLTLNETYISNFLYDIPHDYLDHKIKALRIEIANDMGYVYGDKNATSFHSKVVILVDDLVQTFETMMACLLSIKREKPRKVVIAVPVMNLQIARRLRSKVDSLCFLTLSSKVNKGKEYFADYPEVNLEEVRELVQKFKCE